MLFIKYHFNPITYLWRDNMKKSKQQLYSKFKIVNFLDDSPKLIKLNAYSYPLHCTVKI